MLVPQSNAFLKGSTRNSEDLSSESKRSSGRLGSLSESDFTVIKAVENKIINEQIKPEMPRVYKKCEKVVTGEYSNTR